jgi:hypothetical protein
MHELRGVPEKPDDLIDALERLLAEPCLDNANPVLACVANFRDWEKPPRDAAAQFMEESEWNWREGLAPVADR